MFIYYIKKVGSDRVIKSSTNKDEILKDYDDMNKNGYKYNFDYEYIHESSLYKEVYKNLLSGLSYSDGFHGFKILKDKNIIIYNHYGSSAVDVSFKCLKWLLNKIFMDDFYKLKLCKDGYINMI